MKTFIYTLEQGQNMECPFGGAYRDEFDIGYHGTSSLAENEIESNGFIWSDSVYSRQEIQAVIDVYDQLHWYGYNPDGLCVLKTFTQSDFDLGRINSKKPISFAVESKRCLLYASRIRAGGETAAALRFAFWDLEKYLSDPKFRQEQIWKTWIRLDESVRGLDLPESVDPETVNFDNIRSLWSLYKSYKIKQLLPEPVNYTDHWLKDKLDKLGMIRKRCFQIYDEYDYGVVYAVKFSSEDSCKFRGKIEIIADEFVPPERIVAKAIIPKEFKHNPFYNSDLSERQKFNVIG
jgi:hypothetical protein